jgi:hypothetical protein
LDEFDEIASLVAVLHGSQPTLPLDAPGLVQDGLEADAMLVDGPQLDGGVGKAPATSCSSGRRWALKEACATGSACTWRGRGLRKRAPRCPKARHVT